MTYKTEQEKFWAGEFGDDYIGRNTSSQLLASNIHFFSKCFDKIEKPNSIIEFGANVGMNLRAIKMLYPEINMWAVEINRQAANQLKENITEATVIEGSILDQGFTGFDITLIKTVLIHINPDELQKVYQKLYSSSRKYILICEYYNPSPTTVTYRGNENKLFKRDFAGEMMDEYPDLKLVDYGFSYHRDNSFPQDDINWFLLKK